MIATDAAPARRAAWLTDRARLKLLVVTSTWPLHPGDHRTPFVRNLALDLTNRGWDIAVVAPHAQGAATSETDGPIRLRRFRYMWPERLQLLAYGGGGLINLRAPGRKLLAFPFVAAEMLVVRGAIRQFRPDVVHAHWLLPQGFAAGLAARVAGVPMVVTVHGGDVFGLRSAVFRPFKRAAVKTASAVTCNGPATRREVIGLGAEPDRTRVIRFAPSFEGEIDPAQVKTWRARFPADGKIILFAGRLIPEKGPDDVIEAIARARDPRVHGVICGEGPMRAALQALAVRRGVGGRIHFEGWVDPAGIACRMQGSDALLFPSKTSPDGWVEAQGVVAVEAMRAGLPVFAARSGGIPNVVEHGATGWLFEESDVAAMAGLIDALTDGGLADAAAVVARARDLARREITRENTADAFDHLLRSVAAGARGKAGLA
jgi:glycosyltransferase involved in cell wall biosynthesis